MSHIPEDLKYSREHEWVRAEGAIATIGITHHAEDQLGDIVYADLPPVGQTFKSMEEFGVVESVKSVSSLYSPVSGKVLEVNGALNSAPQLINDDPYGKGWIVKLELSNPAELAALLSAKEYGDIVAK